MNLEEYKKPTLEQFRTLVIQKSGNLTNVAAAFNVSRSTISRWMKADPAFREVVKDERSKIFDESVATSRILAMGIPAYEDVLDEQGNPVLDRNGKKVRKFAGWIERPDPNMLRYFMSTLGRDEGFGEDPVEEDGTVKSGVNIKAWILKQNELGVVLKEEKKEEDKPKE